MRHCSRVVGRRLRYGFSWRAVLAVAICLGRVDAQNNVGPSEQRFNQAIYKGSHNSYARDESLAVQIDSYNVWQLELDIYDFQGSLKVNHLCDIGSLDTADTVETLLTKLQTESTQQGHKFAVIYLDMKGNHDSSDPGCAYTWGLGIKDRLKEAFTSALGASSIYTPSEFLTKDGSAWPSYQNLQSRKFRWAVIADWHGHVPPDFNPNPAGCLDQNPYNCFVQDDFFFAAIGSVPADPSKTPANTVLVNLDAGCNAAPGPTTTSLPPRDNRWLYRGYPNKNCSEICSHMDGAYWDYAVKNAGYNFVATNCLSYDDTFNGSAGALTHSPDPLFVIMTPGPSCPGSNSTCEWGTEAFPFHDLNAAMARASSAVTMLIGKGTYKVTSGNSPKMVKVRVTLEASSGPVILH